MEKEWKIFGDECPRCGNEAEVFTDCKEEGSAYDGDDARCCECGLTGGVNVGNEDDNGDCSAYVDWAIFDDEDTTC